MYTPSTSFSNIKISDLVGINGTGKTTLLNCMGMQDIEPNIYYENISYFMIYEDDGRWYLEVKEGEQVSAGQVIALTGSTGDSTGEHLHFEVRVGGEAVDPMVYLQ